jgi:hypothetical protein
MCQGVKQGTRGAVLAMWYVQQAACLSEVCLPAPAAGGLQALRLCVLLLLLLLLLLPAAE